MLTVVIYAVLAQGQYKVGTQDAQAIITKKQHTSTIIRCVLYCLTKQPIYIGAFRSVAGATLARTFLRISRDACLASLPANTVIVLLVVPSVPNHSS